MGRKPLLTSGRVLSAIQSWVAEHGESPSMEQLRKILDVGSTRTIFRYLERLYAEGDIAKDASTGRLRLSKPATVGVKTRVVPLVGEVPAGALMVAEENIEGWLRLPETFIRTSSKVFLLRVRGNSMNRARVGRDFIENGDLVLVRQQSTGNDGDIVVALIDGEATVKRLVRADGYWVLRPESSEKHKTIVVEPGFRVLGIVTKVFKKGAEIAGLVEE